MRLSLLILMLLFLCTSCSPVKGYAGPTLADENTAYVFFWTESDVATLSMFANEVEISVFDSGVRLLPGKNTLGIRVQVTGCQIPGSFNCVGVVTTQSCIAHAKLQAGKTYRARVNNSGGLASFYVIDEDSGIAVGRGDCSFEAL